MLFTMAVAGVATALPSSIIDHLSPRQATCSVSAVDNLIFSASLSSFQSSRNSQTPSACDWSSDNCSKSPDSPRGYNFVPSCQRHDFGYRNAKAQGRFTDALKERIDNNFKDDLYNYCNGFSGLESWKGVECRRYSDIYVAAVKAFGKREEEKGHYLPELNIDDE